MPATVTALHGSDYPTATSGDMIATWRSETRKTGDIVCSATAILSCPGGESLGIFVVRAAVFMKIKSVMMYNTLLIGEELQKFRRNLLLPSSGSK